jgi:hypothetical protein
MDDFEINYDLRPYMPDIFIKNKIYTSMDSINNNKDILITSSIFIFNIDKSLDSEINDPGYLLFGIKKDNVVYDFPSLNFFYYNKNLSKTQPYKSSPPDNNLNNYTNLLTKIGYNILKINSTQFEYRELIITETTTNYKIKVIYMFFNLLEPEIKINYNNYSSTIYYYNKYWNIQIYPFIKNDTIPYVPSNVFFDYFNNQNKFNSKINVASVIDNIDFDNRENIKYYEKIDYKNLENTDYTMSDKYSGETLQNYSFYINNYHNYILNQLNKKILFFNLNEICKLFYPDIEYNEKNKKTITNTILNNKHINNTKCYSNDINKYSYSFDNKISNLNFIEFKNKNYSCYNYNNITNSSLYQQFINYYLNSYYDYNEINNTNSLSEININLYKIFIHINPRIIDKNYLLNKVNTKINPIFNNSNILEFGINEKKLQLFIYNNIAETDIYYINKYKIEFEFIGDTEIHFTYIIILGIMFYNSSKINIKNKTEIINDNIFMNYTIEENTISLSPTIFNPNNAIIIYEKMINIDFIGLKKYMYELNYNNLSKYKNQYNYIKFNNFYSLIPNYDLNAKTPNGIYYKNVINIKMLKINNFIKNVININDNFNNFRLSDLNVKNYLNHSILFDENIVNKIPNSEKINNECYINYDYKNNCENEDLNINDYNTYIEYFSYFPNISSEYINNPIFNGKYYENFTEFNNNFMILPVGKYVKFNYINYKALYPDIITETFVKSIKNIYNIANYNFSLLCKIPFNINLDDNFYCSNPKFFWSNQYSANIGSNETEIYLILTDSNSKPYTFKGSTEFNGLIYAVKLFAYSNFISENFNLGIVMNLFFNKYINLTQLIFYNESYETYSDINNLIWNVNNSFLKLHNFTNLKEILMYDFKRFKNCYNKIDLANQFKNFNYKILDNLYNNKLQINNLRYDIKVLIYLSNLFKTNFMMEKIYNYLEIIKTNIMMKNFKNELLIDLIKYNISSIGNLYNINYYLQIVSGTLNTNIYIIISKINLLNINSNLENINDLQIECIFILNYMKNKSNFILDLIGSELKTNNNLYYNLYSSIYDLISFELINQYINFEIINDIDNLISNTSLTIFDNYIEFDLEKKRLLLNQIGTYLKILTLNLTKLDELFNLSKLMDNDLVTIALQSNLNLNLNVVKNTYIYNTSCYTTCTGIPVFNIVIFLENTKENILYLKLKINNINSYKNYQKAFEQNIITSIDNTIKYFRDIIIKIINIYKYQKNISGVNNIDIYNPEEIGKFYILLTEFNINFKMFFEILYDNEIDIFIEYKYLEKSFYNLFDSCQEYLLSIRLWNDFMNTNLSIFTNIYVNEDLYKIIKTDTFYDFLNKTIINFNNLIIDKNPNTLLVYLDKILIKVIDNFHNPLQIYVIKEIKLMIDALKEQINTGIIPNIEIIMFGSYYIIPYYDLLLFKNNFLPASFNFLTNLLKTINSIDQINTSIFDYYYNDDEVNNIYVNALGYTYLSTPYKYINLDNPEINE